MNNVKPLKKLSERDEILVLLSNVNSALYALGKNLYGWENTTYIDGIRDGIDLEILIEDGVRKLNTYP